MYSFQYLGGGPPVAGNNWYNVILLFWHLQQAVVLVTNSVNWSTCPILMFCCCHHFQYTDKSYTTNVGYPLVRWTSIVESYSIIIPYPEDGGGGVLLWKDFSDHFSFSFFFQIFTFVFFRCFQIFYFFQDLFQIVLFFLFFSNNQVPY